MTANCHGLVRRNTFGPNVTCDNGFIWAKNNKYVWVKLHFVTCALHANTMQVSSVLPTFMYIQSVILAYVKYQSIMKEVRNRTTETGK